MFVEVRFSPFIDCCDGAFVEIDEGWPSASANVDVEA